MKIVGVIPARWASKRFPGKALVQLHGKPLVVHCVERAREVPSLDRVICATDDDRIAEVVRATGCEVVMTSPECNTGGDRVAEVVRDMDVDVVVNIQGDEPYIHPGVIDAVVRGLVDAPDCGVGTARVALKDQEDFLSPHVVKVVCDPRGRALYFSRSPIPSPARLTDEMMREPGFRWGFKHLGLYAYRRQVLMDFTRWPQTPLERRESLEQLRLMEHGVAIRVVEVEHDSIGVDTPEEWMMLERSGRPT